MRRMPFARRWLAAWMLASVAMSGFAADFPAPVEHDWVAKDFLFRSGESLPQMRIHYTTIGDPKGEPVLILHGTGGSGAGMLSAPFAGELFGPGQPLDATRFFLILPDAIGHGKSAKPSDGLRAAFPKYDYEDMVDANQRLLVEHLGIRRLRLMLGNSMGGMETWVAAEKYPASMDIAVPMASLPTAMAGRNWMLRRLIIDSIRNDPEWQGGNYTTQPKSARFASVFFNLATNGGSQALQAMTPTHPRADAVLDQRLGAPFAADANDVLYQWDASRTFDPSAGLERIDAVVFAINSADDERNPPELGILDREIGRVKHGSALLIPASERTAGHGTTFFAVWWKAALQDVLERTPRATR